MPNASWPATLPQYVLEQGFSESLADQFLESQMEAGAAKRRRRFTRNNRQFTFSMAMTEAQSEVFEDFYDRVLAGGSLPVDWVHPRMRTAITFAFRHPVPKLSEVKGAMRVWSFAVEAITDPSYPAVPSVFSVSAPSSANEGNSGTTNFTFPVTRSVGLAGTASVDWAVTGSSGNPANAADFVGGVLPSGTLNFANGQSSANIVVPVQGDATVEPNEGFTVTISNPLPSGSSITTSTASSTILNDDSAAPTTVSFAYSVGSPGWTFSQRTDVAGKLYLQTLNGSAMYASMWAGLITGTDAWVKLGVAVGGFGSGMIEVSVDGGSWSAPAPISGTTEGELPLFASLSDAAHLVVIRGGVGYGNNNIFQTTSGNQWRVTGSAPALQPYSNWAQPGDGNSNTVTPNALVANDTSYAPSLVPSNDNGYKVNNPAIAVRGDFTELVCATQGGRYIGVSVDGAAPTMYDLGATPKWAQRITGLSGTHTYYVWAGIQGGQMAVGGLAATGISNITSKKRQPQFGDSITEGIGATSQAHTDTFRTAAALGYIGENFGIAGDTTAGLDARLSAILSVLTVTSSDVAIIAIGRNDVGLWDSTTTSHYNSIITKLLAKGFGKVICRGLLPDGDGGYTASSESAIIHGIVTAYSDARVKFADPTGLGPYGSIDNEHPNDAGYVTISNYMTPIYAALGV